MRPRARAKLCRSASKPCCRGTGSTTSSRGPAGALLISRLAGSWARSPRRRFVTFAESFPQLPAGAARPPCAPPPRSVAKSSSWVRSTRRSTSSTSASPSPTSNRSPQCIVASWSVCSSPLLENGRMSTLTQELETLRDWLRYAVSRFNAAGVIFGHGTTNAYDEAAYLLLHTLHLPLDRLEPFLDAKLNHAEREGLQHIIARRVDERIPAAYLTREAWLGEHRFYVDERVLIPRSYIAELLREGLVPWVADPDSIETALDLCTGSGCLAILIAHHFRNADVDAADISSDALAVSLRNVADHGLEGRG